MGPTRVEVVVAGPFRRRLGRPVSGRIWLTSPGPLGDVEFPAARWSDYPGILVEWWLAQLAESARQPGVLGVCRFMDGPYSFTLQDIGARTLDLRFRHRDVPAGDRRANAADFEASLRTAATAILAECDGRGWADQDIERLRSTLASGPHYRAS